MTMRPARLVLAAVMPALLTVASGAHAGPDRDLGSSVHNNIAAQAIDPAPDYTGQPFPGTSGRRAADAVIRYQTGKLKPLLKTNGKTDVGTQGGSNDSASAVAPLVASGTPN